MSEGSIKFRFCDGKAIKLKQNQISDSTQITNSELKVKEITEKIGKIHINNNKSTIAYNDFDIFFTKFTQEIIQMSLPHKTTDKIFSLCCDLVEQMKTMCFTLEKTECLKSCDALNVSSEYIIKKIHENDTHYKRNKLQKKNIFFVEPEEKAMGLKWQTKSIINSDVLNHIMTQPTLQYVPINKTLKTLFMNSDFKNIYMKHNTEEKHECVEGVFRDYCCGSTFKNNNLQFYENAVHIQLGTDDFDVCCPLKSKATIHKIRAVYFQIKNLPAEYSSKLKYIFLVALCETEHLKHSDTSFDDILQLILRDISELETNGIDIGPNENIKGFLINVCSDNLGLNEVFGFKMSFAHDFFCRLCTVTKTNSEMRSEIVDSEIRQKNDYDKIMKLLEKNDILDPKIAQGYKNHCLLNDLKFFHILDNISVDLMHDMHEGNIQFFLKNVINHCIEKHFTFNEIFKRIRDFNYGALNRKNHPSKLNITKDNLGQNATQTYCLFIHLPFILHDLKDKLNKDVCDALALLLTIMRIIYSSEINESQVNELEQLITRYLDCVKKEFKFSFKPKSHFLLHYPEAIRRMGPPKRTWMMRFEAKHKFFTTAAKKTNNYINIAKTLASRHQAITPFSETDIQIRKSKQHCLNTTKYPGTKTILMQHNFAIDDIVALKFIYVNDFEYRIGLLIIEDFALYEIIQIFCYYDKFFILCLSCEVLQFDKFFQSIQFKTNEFNQNNIMIFDISQLKNKQTHNKIICNKNFYIVSNTLNVDELCNHTS